MTNVRIVLKQTGAPVRPDILSTNNGPDIDDSKASLQCLMYNMVLDSILQVHSASTSQSDQKEEKMTAIIKIIELAKELDTFFENNLKED